MKKLIPESGAEKKKSRLLIEKNGYLGLATISAEVRLQFSEERSGAQSSKKLSRLWQKMEKNKIKI